MDAGEPHLLGLAERAFNIRQAKRLFGVIGSGEPLAVILGGLAVPVLLAIFETADLFWLSAVGLGVGIVLILHIGSAYGDQIAEETVAEEETSIEHGRSASRGTSRYFVLIFTAVVLSEIAYYFIDNAFFDRAEARFPEEGDLAGFIGAFYAAAALVSLASNLFVSGRLLRRDGVQAGLLLLPVLLVAISLSVLVAGLAFAAVALVFWLTALTKLVDEGFRNGVYRPAEHLDLLIEYSADANEVVRLSALTSLMLYGGIEGVVAVGERFMAMVRSSNPGERRMATRVLEELGSSRFYRPLRSGADNDRFDQGEPEKVVVVDRTYIEAQAPTVRDRLVKAGVRLGSLLHQALGQ